MDSGSTFSTYCFLMPNIRKCECIPSIFWMWTIHICIRIRRPSKCSWNAGTWWHLTLSSNYARASTATKPLTMQRRIFTNFVLVVQIDKTGVSSVLGPTKRKNNLEDIVSFMMRANFAGTNGNSYRGNSHAEIGSQSFVTISGRWCVLRLRHITTCCRQSVRWLLLIMVLWLHQS